MKAFYTIFLLVMSNVFMTFAWYGHLHFKKMTTLQHLGLVGGNMERRGLAQFEYIFLVPANRLGFDKNDGPFFLIELKTIHVEISLIVSTIITIYVFKTDKFAWNHAVGFALIVLAVFFIFKKW